MQVDGRREGRQAIDAERLAQGLRGRPALQPLALMRSPLVVEGDEHASAPTPPTWMARRTP
jgi:hypothetical protein